MRRDQSAGNVPALDMAHALLAFGQTDSALVWIGRSVARHEAEPDWNGLVVRPDVRRVAEGCALRGDDGADGDADM